jgi:hypothetical protein
MEDTKQANGNSPKPLSAEEATSISGGVVDATCPTTVTVGTSGANVVVPAPSPSDGLIAVYEGFVDVTSHIIERVAAAAK